MRKGIKKQFWLSEKDAADLKQKAQRCGITETAMIRMLLHSYEPREKPDERFYEAMREMYAIGNNLNQLTAKAHKLGFIDTPMLRELSRAFARFQLKIEQNFLLPVSQLHTFEGHPYKVLDNEEMDSLVESIKEQGKLHSRCR